MLSINYLGALSINYYISDWRLYLQQQILQNYTFLISLFNVDVLHVWLPGTVNQLSDTMILFQVWTNRNNCFQRYTHFDVATFLLLDGNMIGRKRYLRRSQILSIISNKCMDSHFYDINNVFQCEMTEGKELRFSRLKQKISYIE